MGLDQPVNRLRPHIPDHHHDGVVGRIPIPVPRAHVLDRQAVQIRHPTDHRLPIGTGVPGGGLKGLVGQGLGVVFGAQAAFFLDHLQLAFELIGVHAGVAHAIRLQGQHPVQVLHGDFGVVGRVVGPGEGVLGTAEGGDDAGVFVGRKLFGAQEQHVLQHMGNAGDPAALVAGADPVPDLGDGHRRAVVFHHHQLEPVVQPIFADAVFQFGGLRRWEGQRPYAQQKK